MRPVIVDNWTLNDYSKFISQDLLLWVYYSTLFINKCDIKNDCFNLLIRKTDEALNDKPGQSGRALQKLKLLVFLEG
jgi:hypothetical protein